MENNSHAIWHICGYDLIDNIEIAIKSFKNKSGILRNGRLLSVL